MENKKEETICFDHLPTTEEILKAYEKQQENNPLSTYYKRQNTKPKLHLLKVFFLFLIVISLSTGICLLAYSAGKNKTSSILLACSFLLLVGIIHIKGIFIWLIKLYQHIAPKKLRNKCRFEPSCSQYMLLAIEKYGFIKGVKKGVDRLKRCKHPNGGVDYP